jgi:hypothetical protein
VGYSRYTTFMKLILLLQATISTDSWLVYL